MALPLPGPLALKAIDLRNRLLDDSALPDRGNFKGTNRP
jgi:hypothetical protein